MPWLPILNLRQAGASSNLTLYVVTSTSQSLQHLVPYTPVGIWIATPSWLTSLVHKPEEFVPNDVYTDH